MKALCAAIAKRSPIPALTSLNPHSHRPSVMTGFSRCPPWAGRRRSGKCAGSPPAA